EIEDLVVRELGGSALFTAHFREAAGRALLIPRHRPGQRAPLWMQRKRAADLLAVASRFGSFPIILETYRECLQDVFDLPSLVDLLRRIRRRELRVVTVDAVAPSPFSSSLLFGYVANYIYDGGVPPPLGLPRAFLEPVADALGALVARYARTHGPFTAADVGRRYGVAEERIEQALRRLAETGRVLEGEFRPGGIGREWCDASVL